MTCSIICFRMRLDVFLCNSCIVLEPMEKGSFIFYVSSELLIVLCALDQQTVLSERKKAEPVETNLNLKEHLYYPQVIKWWLKCYLIFLDLVLCF